uniref:Uncharacterized protein n=1 Tax=Sphaerodactylus townsendi TaxID=933632 RepID=A0ACB8EIH6_9SAUR
MPKKKKKSSEELNSLAQDQREEEPREASNVKLKRSFDDAFIVISDSDGEVWELAVALLILQMTQSPCDLDLAPLNG